MVRRPRFKAHYHVRVVSEDETVVLWETGYRILRSRLVALLAPWLDGRHSIDDVASLLASRLTPLDVTFGIQQLTDSGYVEGVEHIEDEGRRAFLGLLGASLPAHFVVHLRSTGNVETSALEEALRQLNVAVTQDARLTVVVTDDYLRPELSNMQAPWLLIKPVGIVGSIGPLFLPESGPCWHCLAARLQENPEVRILQEFPRGLDERPYSIAALSSTSGTIVQLAATEAYKYLASGAAGHLLGTLITLDFLSLETKRHTLLRREGCRHCPVQSEPLGTVLPMGDERHVSPITGIVASVEPLNVPNASAIHVYAAVHNFTLQYGRKSSAARWLGNRSIGKGTAAAQARYSALCEALERYSGCWRGYETARFCSAKELSDAAVPIENCLLFSESQYAHRDQWNQREGEYNFVPRRFDPDRRVPWVELWSLTQNLPRYLPAAFCYYNVPIDEDHDFCRPDSNGNAAGPSLQEAILAGIFEVVERDAAAIWWYNQARRPGVQIESFPLPYFADLVADYARLGRRLWALGLTTGFGIPVFVSISQSLAGNDEPVAGFGAHFDPQIALVRACTEVNQAIAAIEGGATVRIALGNLPSQEFLHPDPAQSFVRYSNPTTSNIDRDLHLCVDRARELGIEILVLDQTRADVALPVAKVVMPGMRHFWARFAPGRLYNVPSPKHETDLNPAHLIL